MGSWFTTHQQFENIGLESYNYIYSCKTKSKNNKKTVVINTLIATYLLSIFI